MFLPTLQFKDGMDRSQGPRRSLGRIEAAPALPPIWRDAVQLQQVLLNVILNALDAMTDCPTAERQAVVRAAPYPPLGVEVTVTDQGPGFSKEKLRNCSSLSSRRKRTAWGWG